LAVRLPVGRNFHDGRVLRASAWRRHSVADVCRQMGISEAMFYVWKKKERSGLNVGGRGLSHRFGTDRVFTRFVVPNDHLLC